MRLSGGRNELDQNEILPEGLVDTLELPGKDLALVSVQRSSRVIAGLHDGRIIARDWKTGGLLRGELERRRFGIFGR